MWYFANHYILFCFFYILLRCLYFHWIGVVHGSFERNNIIWVQNSKGRSHWLPLLTPCSLTVLQGASLGKFPDSSALIIWRKSFKMKPDLFTFHLTVLDVLRKFCLNKKSELKFNFRAIICAIFMGLLCHNFCIIYDTWWYSWRGFPLLCATVLWCNGQHSGLWMHQSTNLGSSFKSILSY